MIGRNVRRMIALGLAASAACSMPSNSMQSAADAPEQAIDALPYSHAFHVIEFRRYTIKSGQRDAFARYFDTLFPEAFQQLGAIAVGEFLERDKADGFTWIRAFKTIEDRAIVNSSFYFGPVWKEHKATLNALIVDSDNVLLMRPLDEEGGFAVLPAVDPVRETSVRRGVVLAQLFRSTPDGLAELTHRVGDAFARYRSVGAREAGVFVTLDVPNNFPQLPIRTDGPYLLWLGVSAPDALAEERLLAQMKECGQALIKAGLVREPPEIIVLAPTPRSRLRWQAADAAPHRPSALF